MAVKIQFRRDTGTNWTSNNPILLEGELGLNTTTDKFKVGDGTTAWNSLAYVYGDWNTLLNKPATFTPTTENVQDIVGDMVSSNTESGITVTYEDSDGTLDFNVNDPTIALTGDVTGSAVMTDLGNVSIATTVSANSVALGTDTTGNYMTDVTAGTGVSVSHTASEGSTATISIGQAVGTTDDPTFNNLIVDGNLTVSGTTTTINTETINLADNIVLINSNETGTPSQDGGIEIERGTSTNKTLVWNETSDKWTVGSETFVAGTVEASITGNVTGNVTGDVTGDLTGNVTGNVTGTITGAASLNVLKAGDTMTGLLTLSGAPTGANHAATKSYVDSVTTAQDLDFSADSGGALAIDLDSEAITFTGGTGITTVGSGNDVSIGIDSTVTTLIGAQTLTNKTLTSPILDGTISGTSIKDEDNLVSDSASHLATQQSIKAYVDAQHAAMNELSELTDTVISTPSAGQVLVYDGTNSWDNQTTTIALTGDVSGSANMDASGDVSITATIADDSHNHIITNVDGLQTALDLKAPLASPTFTGTPLSTTAVAGTNTTQIATTAFVTAAVSSEDTLAEMNDVTITSVADNDIIAYDSATSKYINQSASEAGVATASDLTSHTGSTSNPHSVTATQVSLGNVTNESKATMFTSPTFTGTPLSTTAVAGTNTTQIATTAFVTAAVSSEDTLAEMNDTTISAPADSHFLVHTGSSWVNETGATARTSLGVDAAGTINYSLPTADASTLGGIKVGTNLSIAAGVLSSTDTTYSTATTSTEGLVKLEDGTAQTVAANTVTATASRTYGVQLNASGQAVVNVPWVDTDTNTTYSTATASTSGLVKIEDDTDQTVAANTVSATAGKTYGVQLNSSDQAVVNVPWTDTDTNQLTTFTVSATTDTTPTTISQGDDLMFTAGTGITCETTADGTVTISNTVTDTNTTYSAGTGITLTGTTFAAGPIALTTVQVAASQIAQLALTAQEGDVAVRSDEKKSYMHNGGSAGSMADWTELQTPTDSVLSVNGNTGVITAAQIATAVEAATDSNTFTDADHTKLNAVEASATSDQTPAEIKTAYESNADTNEFSDAEQTKLSGIDTSADVTDATTVAAAGAVMEADTTTSSMSFVIDEDTLSSDSSTKVPTQQSVKAYVDAHTHSGYTTMDDVIAMAIALG
jgi:hypothetical protein